MTMVSARGIRIAAVAAFCAAWFGSFGAPALQAADHGDAPGIAGDQSCDIADVYFFLDPNDNTQAVLVATFRGFIVAGEAVNFGIYDPTVRYRFQIENTGDATPDKFINVSFNRRVADPGPAGKEILQVQVPQTATIEFENFVGANGKKIKTKNARIQATATNPSLAASAPTQVVTDLTGLPIPGVKFFAGEVDDPFFFDIPAFGRFIGSVRSGAPDPAVFDRARDTFAGYNALSIAFRLPVSELRGEGTVVGVNFLAQRRGIKYGKPGEVPKGSGKFKTVDRMGVPGVNVALVPFNRKDEYNNSKTEDDAEGKFAGDIVATLQALGTSEANIGVLASVAVTNGDLLRLETDAAVKPNTGNGGGDNAGSGFPNGRRLKDDIIDIELTIIAGAPFGDNVDASDIPPQNTFPFVAQSQQPFATGVTDDNTRN